jgi:hypothetical protein
LYVAHDVMQSSKLLRLIVCSSLWICEFEPELASAKFL